MIYESEVTLDDINLSIEVLGEMYESGLEYCEQYPEDDYFREEVEMIKTSLDYWIEKKRMMLH